MTKIVSEKVKVKIAEYEKKLQHKGAKCLSVTALKAGNYVKGSILHNQQNELPESQ